MAKPAALASIAAHNQGKFWQFHDLLFERQKDMNPDTIFAVAQEVHLDMTRFMNDMRDNVTAQKLANDTKQASEAGVTGTPSIYVNGRKLKNRNFEQMKKLIDDELATQKK